MRNRRITPNAAAPRGRVARLVPISRGEDDATTQEHRQLLKAEIVNELSGSLKAADAEIRDLKRRLGRVEEQLEAIYETRLGAVAARWLDTIADSALRPGVALMLAITFLLALRARAADYALRVTSDTPTFLALLTDMAAKPFASQSPFLNADVQTQHATPYMQALSFLWQGVGGGSGDPAEMGRFLSLVGIGVFGFLLYSLFVVTRRYAGSVAAWVSIPVLLTLFGPPHVIWATDVTLHGALYAGFFPQNLALALTLLTVVLLDRRSGASLAGAVALTALTMLIHPFTGVILCVLATVQACVAARQDDGRALRAPLALVVGFALGSLWPAYSLNVAFAETGLPGVTFVALCAALPVLVLYASTRELEMAVPDVVHRVLEWIAEEGLAARLAIAGLGGTAMLVVWELILVASPPAESARLSIYWVDDRWRWPLMLIGGAIGATGLARLALRGKIVPLVWFGGCFALGAMGAVGLPVPVWYRFLLLCQLPLAIGVGVAVAASGRSRTTALVAGTVLISLVVKIGTLETTDNRVSYLGQPLQPAWELTDAIPRGPGLVATDPATAYFVPATTGRKVLTVDKGHVSSRHELALSAEGYDLLRRFYVGGDDWWTAAQEMWTRGVRYVVVAKQVTLEPPTLYDFIWQTARLETDAHREALGRYYYANNRVGTVVYDSPDFVVYRLDKTKLFGNAQR